jgi:hypothetical protein
MAAAILTTATQSPLALDYTLGAIVLGAMAGFTLWLLGVAFDLIIIAIKSLVLDLWRLLVVTRRSLKAKRLE